MFQHQIILSPTEMLWAAVTIHDFKWVEITFKHDMF